MVMPSFASPWAPEEAARYEVELSRLLALADGRTRREHYHRMGVRESARAQVAERTRAKAAKAEAEHDRAGTGGAQCDDAVIDETQLEPAAETRTRGKSDAQRQRSKDKLSHKWLEKRCCAAAGKAGGSSPRVLALVLGAVARFISMLEPEGTALMKRLRERSPSLPCPASCWRAAHGLPAPVPPALRTPTLAATVPMMTLSPQILAKLPGGLSLAGGRVTSKQDESMAPAPVAGKRDKESPSRVPGSPSQVCAQKTTRPTGQARLAAKAARAAMEAAASSGAQEALQHPTDTSNIYSALATQP